MLYYRRIFREQDELKQLALIVDACEKYEDELPAALAETKPPAGKIETAQNRMAGITAENYSRLQDLEIILQHVTNMEDRRLMNKAKYYKENYQRDLTDRMAEKYADVHDEVQEVRSIRHYVAHVRNQYLAVSKGLEVMHYQIGNLTKLRAVGLDDATF